SRAPVATASALTLQAECSFDDMHSTDIVIVPSLLLPDVGWPAGKYPHLIDWLQRQYRQGAVLSSACSGVFPLLETGLFDSEPVTCHWFYESLLRKAFPRADVQIDKTLIIAGEDQRLLMSGASGSWHDL